MVEVDLDDELGAQRNPLEVAPRAPAGGVGGAALARLVWGEKADETALLGGGETGAVADDTQGVAVVEREDQRAHRVGLLAWAPPRHDGVGGAGALDLEHPPALPRPVGSGALLGDRALGVLQPAFGLADGVDGGHQLDRGALEIDPAHPGEQRLERRAARAEGLLQQGVVVAREQVEGDVHRGRLAREQLDARGGRVDALAERVEVLAAGKKEKLLWVPRTTISPSST